ncbi:MAG: AMP-binding protein, partial [Gammaproteobacteria bacterium]|nr:AMP-binding protein [Gammaproteobacteria bacterium]
MRNQTKLEQQILSSESLILARAVGEYCTERQIIEFDILSKVFGQVVVLCVNNSVESASTLLLLLSRSFQVLVLPNHSTQKEIELHAKRVKASHVIEYENSSFIVSQLDTPTDHPAKSHVAGIYLFTSGSSGEAKVVFRSTQSWFDEAQRYISLLNLQPKDRVLIVSPIYHAYSLGWLWAVFWVRAKVRILSPEALSAIKNDIQHWAHYVVLTPNIARLLTLRYKSKVNNQLKIVMAGAGPVSQTLDDEFKNTFEVRLSRNYGSTETGAVFSGIAPQPAYSIGTPMPGISLDPVEQNDQVFPLTIKLEDGSLHGMGDLVRKENNRYYIVGRETHSIRRGERWISPFEIENVIQSHPEVNDCFVRGVSLDARGNDYIIASVSLKLGSQLDRNTLANFCKQELSTHKVPDVVDITSEIKRDTKGKHVGATSYRPVGGPPLQEIINAYKRSHLLFSLFHLGILDGLINGLTIDQIAVRIGCNPSELEQILEVAHLNGLLTTETSPDLWNEWCANCVKLELENNAKWNSVEELSSAIRRGFSKRKFSTSTVDEQFSITYSKAMQGPHKEWSTRLVLRYLNRIYKKGFSWFDISATNGMYSKLFRQQTT